jgi:hypothetical protein
MRTPGARTAPSPWTFDSFYPPTHSTTALSNLAILTCTCPSGGNYIAQCEIDIATFVAAVTATVTYTPPLGSAVTVPLINAGAVGSFSAMYPIRPLAGTTVTITVNGGGSSDSKTISAGLKQMTE